MPMLRLYCRLLVCLSILLTPSLSLADEPAINAEQVATSGFPFTNYPAKILKRNRSITTSVLLKPSAA